MFQRISLNWELSELSPVWMASASGRPVTGPIPILLISRTMASAIWPDRNSCGRYAELNSVGGIGDGSSSRSANSSRSGDWASTMWTSLSWANAIIGVRDAWRPGAAAAPRSVRSIGSSPGRRDHRAYPPRRPCRGATA